MEQSCKRCRYLSYVKHDGDLHKKKVVRRSVSQNAFLKEYINFFLVKNVNTKLKIECFIRIFLITIECEVLKQFREENLFCRKDFSAKKKIYWFRKDNVKENRAL